MQYYTATDAARYLGKAEKTVRRWIKRGQLPATKTGGAYRISKRSLDTIAGYRATKIFGQRPDATTALASPLVDEFRRQLTELTDKNDRLTFQLGQAVQENRHLQDKITLLEAPKQPPPPKPESKRQWWRLWRK